MLPGARVVAHGYDHVQPQIPQRLPCKMERHEVLVPHVSIHTRGRQDDDVFTRHVSDAGNDGTGDVP